MRCTRYETLTFTLSTFAQPIHQKPCSWLKAGNASCGISAGGTIIKKLKNSVSVLVSAGTFELNDKYLRYSIVAKRGVRFRQQASICYPLLPIYGIFSKRKSSDTA